MSGSSRGRSEGDERVGEAVGEPAEGRGRRKLVWRLLGAAIALASIVFVVRSLADAWDDSRDFQPPSVGAWLAGAALVVPVPIAAAWAWAALLDAPRSADPRIRLGFYGSQLAKYLPGGVVQLASQAGTAVRAGVPRARVAVALPLHALIAAVVTGATGAFVLGVVDDDLSARSRWLLVVAGAAAIPILWRRWLVGLLAHGHRRWSVIPDATNVPAQATILKAFAFGLLGFVANGLAFFALLDVPWTLQNVVIVVSGFSAAFTAGFLVLPVPSGAGVREAAVLLLLGTVTHETQLLAAAVAHRLVALVFAEIGVFIVAGAAYQRGRSRSMRGSTTTSGRN